MSIIERRRMLVIGVCCTMTIITLSAGMQFVAAQALIGAAAPAFTLTDSNGRNLSLADFKGKTVVLAANAIGNNLGPSSTWRAT
jgi:cytochrome oxidase Cu insertion factor (SCO1/SenC/PrrC family)